MADLPQRTPDDRSTGINSPDISPRTLKRRRRAVETVEEAQEIIKRLVEENRDRNTKNARIMAKYNAEAPRKPSELKAEGLDWMSNFSTKPLSTLIDKIAPRFVKALDAARYLTAAALPDNTPGAAAKTEFFRAEFTKTVRAHPEYRPTIENISQEDALFGYCAAIFTDEYSWWPTFFRQDEFFVPSGAKQTPSTFQVSVARETFLPHELFEQIQEDREAADTAGWHVDNVVEAINDAAPVSVAGSDNARQYEDLQREASLAMSLGRGAKVIEAYHLFAQEVTGEVTHWILDGRNYKELFYLEDRFPSMADPINPFTWQQANGTIHGSKGIGREVYNIAAAIDRARNEAFNSLQLSGKLIFRGDEKLIRRFRMSVIGNALIFPSTYELQQAKLEGNTEPFLKLDQYATQLVDQMVGGATPREFMGERVTKAAVELYASREEERRDSTLDRFLRCAANMFTSVQRRLLSKDARDEAAKQLREKLLTRLTEEEIEYLRNQPAVSTVDDLTETENQIVAALATEHAQDPLCNQVELRRRKFTALLGADFADAVVLPVNDPTEEAEQVRFQLLENALISLGKQVPVSPRDNHKLHIGAIAAEVQPIAAKVVSDPQIFAFVKGLVGHARAHLDAALQSGAKPADFAQEKAQIEAVERELATLEASAAQQTAPQPQQAADPTQVPAAEPQPAIA